MPAQLPAAPTPGQKCCQQPAGHRGRDTGSCVPVPPSLGSPIQGAGFMPWEQVMNERVLYAQAWPNVSLGKGCPSVLHLPSEWISWDRSDVLGERSVHPSGSRGWWLQKAVGRRYGFSPHEMFHRYWTRIGSCLCSILSTSTPLEGPCG